VAKTSESHPIRVDFVDDELIPGGRLGLTFAPGKVQLNAVSGPWERDVRQDLRRIRSHFGADIVVGLIEDHEFDDLEITHLPDTADALSIDYRRFPIRDGSVPADPGAFDELVDELVDELENQRTVVVHCKGGLGRAGTLAASVLVRCGHEPEDAIAAVRAARYGAIENSAQEEFIRTVASR
jgi:protein-tyrosine phosphatase